MMPTAAEIAVLRRNADAWIKYNPLSIVLLRSTPAVDASGGIVTTQSPLLAQTMRMIMSGNQLPVRRGIDGMEVQPEYVLDCYWDADISRGDRFMLGGVEYEVVFVHPDRFEMTRAEVVYRG
jgi:hypothetical protein